MFFFQLFDPFSFLKKEFYHHLLPDRLAPSSLPVTNACFLTISFSSKKSRINENHIFFQFRKLLLRKKNEKKRRLTTKPTWYLQRSTTTSPSARPEHLPSFSTAQYRPLWESPSRVMTYYSMKPKTEMEKQSKADLQ